VTDDESGKPLEPGYATLLPTVVGTASGPSPPGFGSRRSRWTIPMRHAEEFTDIDNAVEDGS
jgi:hypothetical protein